jgi:hypothetical protein
MCGLNKRTWFTDNTEVLTETGWVNISTFSKIERVITKSNGLLKGEALIEYNIGNVVDSDVLYFKSGDIFITAKYIHFPDNKIWRVDNNLCVPKFKTVKYTGKIYNLVTKSNNIITRNYTNYNSNNNDYILSLCAVK